MTPPFSEAAESLSKRWSEQPSSARPVPPPATRGYRSAPRLRNTTGMSRRQAGPLIRELHDHRVSDDPGLMSPVQEDLNRFPAGRTIIECPLVYIHPDELVGGAAVQAPGVLHRVIEGAGPVLQSVRNALPEMAGNRPNQIGTEVLTDDVSAKRQRQPGRTKPPLTHVGDQLESPRLVRQLTLVDDHSGVHVARQDCVLDLVEGHVHGFDLRLKQTECQGSRGQGPGGGDALAGELLGAVGLPGDQSGPVLVAHRAAM